MNYTFLTAKNSDIIPAINGLPLHSTIDPVREAQKLLATIPNDIGFFIFFGLGGGFAPLAALNSGARILVIDYNKSAVNQLLASKDYSPLLNNKNFTLLIDPANNEIQSFILANYKPALYGGIKVIPLRTRTDHDKELFENAALVIQKAIEITSGDYTVQAHFGKRWFCNIIRNIAYMRVNIQNNDTECFFSKKPKETAIVAAGPSLNFQIKELFEYKANKGFIICSDTALGVLLHNGIKPNVIVSIDCQHISFRHFAGYSLRSIPLVLDIASSAMLAGFSSNPIWTASGHPLAQYFSDKCGPLPKLDTSGGNVSYACLSLAENLGAQNVSLFGADFAFVQGRTYAKGTYVYPYFEIRQNRFLSLEAQLSKFLYRAPFLPVENPGQNYRETAQLRFYSERLEEKAGIGIAPGSGKVVQISLRKNTEEQKTQSNIKHNKSPVEFLVDYRKDIVSAEPGDTVFTTLLPYAAFLKHRNQDLRTTDLLEETKRCCIAEIDKVL